MTNIPAAIVQMIDTIYARAFGFATALAAVGVISMAFLQTIKDVLPVRRWFQAWWVGGWLTEQAAGTPALATGAVNVAAAQTDLVRLATSGDRAAPYAPPTHQLTPPMNAAPQLVPPLPAP